MTAQEIAEAKAEIKRIVAWQFDRVVNLTPEAYNDSLCMIADQIVERFTLPKIGKE